MKGDGATDPVGLGVSLRESSWLKTQLSSITRCYGVKDGRSHQTGSDFVPPPDSKTYILSRSFVLI